MEPSITTISIPMESYPKLLNGLQELSEIERVSHLRNLCRTNLYFLLRYALNRPDVEHPWLYARCNEVQEAPNEYLDLWSREHYKSTIITFAKSIQDILGSHGEDPLPSFAGREVTLGIFSFNRGIALDFVSQIKNELENNKFLKYLFPDILYPEPERQSPQWSVQGGINVIRQSNPKESTLEGWGLVDSMPTGRHFVGRIYDDVITERYARSPEMIAKSTESWELSLNLGSRGGYSRYVGTRYNYNDTYRAIMQREAATPRLYPATDDGKITGNPVLLTPDELAKKRREMGPYTFGCQMMQDPKADEVQGLKKEWMRFYRRDEFSPRGMNLYLLCDPASEKKKTSDYTAMAVVGIGPDGNKYLVDLLRDRLNLTERTRALMRFHRTYAPKQVGYEKYGKDSDIEHIESVQNHENYRFEIIQLGGTMHKNDRIRRIIPDMESGIWYFPDHIYVTDYEGKDHDLIEDLINDEIDPFPVGTHDDMLDVISRIYDEDIDLITPKPVERQESYQKRRKRSPWVR